MKRAQQCCDPSLGSLARAKHFKNETTVNELFDIADRLVAETAFPCVLATLVQVEGSSYRRAGARRLIAPNHSSLGAISGGCLERDIDAHAAELLCSPSFYKTITYDTSSENDILWGTGTGCHGVVQILLEKLTECPSWARQVLKVKNSRKSVALMTIWESADKPDHPIGTTLRDAEREYPATCFADLIEPPPQLVIFGAGEDAIPLHGLANQMGWPTKIFDPRPEFASSSRFPGAATVECVAAEKAATRVEWDDRTVAVIMTHHYRFDLPLLKTLLPLHLTYLGLLGPKARGKRLLADAGYRADDVILNNPVGLDLGGDGSAAVALAIVSEIQARLHGRSARPLSDRMAPIHRDD